MRTINIKPVEIFGDCLADLTLDDQFQVKEMKLDIPRACTLCFQALSYFPPIILQLQQENHFYAHATCGADCVTDPDSETCVTFLLGHADKWDLCQAISEYRRLRRRYPEPDSARQLWIEATQCQKQGEFVEAAQKMESALQELQRYSS